MACPIRTLVCLLSALCLLPQLSWEQHAATPSLVNEPYIPFLIGLRNGYAHRLEAHLPYQQALLPTGVTSSETYWVQHGQTFRLVTADRLGGPDEPGRGQGSTGQEFNSLEYLNGRWRVIFSSAYGEKPSTGKLDYEGKMPTDHTYLYYANNTAGADYSQPERHVVHKNFDPLRLVEGRLPAQPDSTCFFYVLDYRPNHLGDTLLSYHLLQLPEGTHHLTLHQRVKREQPRWSGNNHITQTWDYTPRTRTLCSTAANGSEWRRQYGTGKNFVEVLTYRVQQRLSTYRKPVYSRRRTYSVGRALDRYTVSYYTAQETIDYSIPPKGKVTFTIATDFR